MAEDHRPVDYDLEASSATIHTTWDRELDPVQRIEPGETVRFECREATNGQLGPDSSVADLDAVDLGQVHPLTGPVAIEGASPGDVLEVEILELAHHGWGYTLALPGAEGVGLLPEAFPDPAYHVWELGDGMAHFGDGIAVPLAPFPGIVGVAPAAAGAHDTMPPRNTGGNIDVKHLTAGSRVFLPIAVTDALFSIGDCHAAQGDGEVCVTAIEAPMSVTCRFDCHQDRSIETPRFETSGPFTPTGRDERAFATTGIDDDLRTAAKIAVSELIDHLAAERGLTRTEAYLLCSAAVDLKLNQVSNPPNWTVSAYLPESIFPPDRRR